MGEGEDGSIVRRDGVVFGEHDVCSSPAACFAGVEVGGVGVGREDHAAGMVEDAIIGISGAVVQKMIKLGVGGFCGCCLLGANFTEGMKKLVVNHPRIVEKCAYYALNAFDAKFIKGWGGVGIISVLNCGTIDDGCSLVGREDWSLGSLVVVFGEHCVDVVFHGETTGALGVVPGEVDACVEVALPVFGEVVEFFDGVSEVVSVVVANVFDSEVVYYEGEHDGSPPVSPETWCAFALVVALFVKTFGKEFLRQDA